MTFPDSHLTRGRSSNLFVFHSECSGDGVVVSVGVVRGGGGGVTGGDDDEGDALLHFDDDADGSAGGNGGVYEVGVLETQPAREHSWVTAAGVKRGVCGVFGVKGGVCGG